MAYCSSCGAKGSPDALFCDECGTTLKTSSAIQQPVVIAMPPPPDSRLTGTAGGVQTVAAVAVAARPELNLESTERVEVEDYALKGRYEDAYRLARGMIAQGNAVKVGGWFLAGLIVVAGCWIFANSPGPTYPMQPTGLQGIGVIVSIVIGVVVGVYFHGKGSLICAGGQTLLAMLDCAVHTSPFMSDALRADVMSLPWKRSAGAKVVAKSSDRPMFSPFFQ